MPDSFTITFEDSRKVLQWSDVYDSLLELALANGIDHPYSCRMGTCYTCVAQVKEGAFHYEREPFIEGEKDEIFLCCARPDSDLTLKA